MGALTDALQFAGNVLDTPGSVARGLLAGEGGRALRGILNPDERVSGRDMLESWGALSPNQEGLDWGDVAGFGAEMVADPLNLIGGAGLLKNPGGAIKAAKTLWDEAPRVMGITPELGVLPMGVMKQYAGDGFKMLSDDAAAKHWRPILESAAPEELGALGAYSRGAQERISYALRDKQRRFWQRPQETPFDQYQSMVPEGMPTLGRPEDVISDYAPYLDSLISRSAVPHPTATFRLADQIGGMNAGNAHKFIGKTVSDPSYLSTTITPWGRYVNSQLSPDSLHLSMLLPEGSTGTYFGGSLGNIPTNPGAARPRPIHGYPSEYELLLPRDAQFAVKDVIKQPIGLSGNDWHFLDDNGVPYPSWGRPGQGVSVEAGADGLIRPPMGWTAREPMTPEIAERMASQFPITEKATVNNVLLEMLGAPMASHTPAIRVRTPAERVEMLRTLLNNQLGRFDPREQQYLADSYSKLAWNGRVPRRPEVLDTPVADLLAANPSLRPEVLDKTHADFFTREGLEGVPDFSRSIPRSALLAALAGMGGLQAASSRYHQQWGAE